MTKKLEETFNLTSKVEEDITERRRISNKDRTIK